MSSACQRRDVFDAETVREFARVVGSAERLKMLCLLTYADIRAVNPEALTPWKAELLWQLYVATANYLTRSVDDERVRITGPTKKSRACLPSWKARRDAGGLALLSGRLSAALSGHASARGHCPAL